MKLILTRHGETYANLDQISQGHLNSQLTSKGVEQAKKVSRRLRSTKIDITFSSDLDRALNTCNEILKFHKSTILIKTTILREQAKGIFEGKTREERNKTLEYDNIPYHQWLPEGGERLIDVWERVVPFVDKIKEKYANKTVLIVSHGGPISCILSYLHGKNIECFGDYLPRENTAVSIVSISANINEFEVLNCAAHLE